MAPRDPAELPLPVAGAGRGAAVPAGALPAAAPPPPASPPPAAADAAPGGPALCPPPPAFPAHSAPPGAARAPGARGDPPTPTCSPSATPLNPQLLPGWLSACFFPWHTHTSPPSPQSGWGQQPLPPPRCLMWSPVPATAVSPAPRLCQAGRSAGVCPCLLSAPGQGAAAVPAVLVPSPVPSTAPAVPTPSHTEGHSQAPCHRRVFAAPTVLCAPVGSSRGGEEGGVRCHHVTPAG